MYTNDRNSMNRRHEAYSRGINRNKAAGSRYLSKSPNASRYVVTVKTRDTKHGFFGAYAILDRKNGMYYSSRSVFDDPSLPRIAATLVMAARQLITRHPDGNTIILMPDCEETECVNGLYSLWKEGSDAFYAHEDYNFWQEVFELLGSESSFVTYLADDLPTVKQCTSMFPQEKKH